MSDGSDRHFGQPRRNTTYFLGNREPTLDELTSDPIAALLRRSDNITLNDVHAALRTGRGCVAGQDRSCSHGG